MANTVRQLAMSDMGAAAAVHRAAFDAALPWLAGLHTPDEDRWFYRERVFRDCALSGAFQRDELAGFIALRKEWIDQLYVHPEAQGRGVGSALLDLAKTTGDRLHLWTFQRNMAARRFYERRGFVLVEETDGARNEEREPDALYRWTRA
ncbi:GNAT superfamily N-acetyltransferase [Bradyrhizobium sp. USDA 4369]